MQILFNNIKPQNNVVNHSIFKPQFSVNAYLNSDVISFTGQDIDLFAMDDKSILKKVKKSIKKQNSIGRGGEAEVYKIPDTSYCVRVLHDSFDKLGKVVDRNILPSEKVNHTVAKLGNGVTIMPLLEGYTFCSENITNAEVAKMIEDMPQKAIDSLFKQVCNAYNNNMSFDTGWKNVIVNPVDKTLTAIDFVPNNDNFSNDNILSKVYLSLTNNPDTTISQRKIFAGKFLTALVENVEPMKFPITDIEMLGMGQFVKVLKSHKLFDNNLYVKLLQGILVKVEDLKQQEFFGKNIVDDLNGQLKVLKSLIKQLF